MAVKVNKSVVIGLIVGVVCMVVGVVVVLQVVFKSGADLAAQGDTYMAAQDYEKAATAYSKAVNKDQNNVEYYRKWADAISHQNPVSIQAYTDRYRQWLGTQRGIANVLRTDPAAHKVVMDLSLRDARISPRGGPAWQSLESDASDVLNRMSGQPQDKLDQIRRYRGIATVGKLGQAMDVSVEDKKRAKEDLLAAMKVNPDDTLAAVYYADLMRLGAAKLRQSNNADDAALMMAEGLAVMSDFCAKHPSSTAARLGLVQLQLADLAAQAANGAPSEDLQTKVGPMIEGLMATLEAEDPKTVDEFIATQVLDTAVANRVNNAVSRGVAVFDKIVASRQGEPFSLLMRARFRATTDTPREAVNEFKAIMDLPNLPVSPLGISLFGVRDSAAVQRVDALIGLTERAKTPEDRAKALLETKAARDDLRARSTIDSPPKTLIDAKIALLSGESADARRLLDQYHKATGYTDPAAMMLSARVLASQGLKGEAKTMLGRIVDMRRATADVYKMLAALDYDMGNYPSALNWIELAIQMAPTDASLIDMRKVIADIIKGAGNANPFDRAIAEAKAAMLVTPPELDKVRAKGEDALSLASTAPEFARCAAILRVVDRPTGLKAVTRGLEKFPDDATLNQLKKQFEIEDPFAERIRQLDADPNIKPVDKLLQKYLLYSQTGKVKEAAPLLDEAAKLDPDHPMVVAGMFERTLAERDAEGKVPPASLEKARALSQKAKEKNLDKVEGRIYAARLAEAEGKYAEAIPLLERATEIDGQNPLTWRYLSNAYQRAGDLTKALAAITRSLQIKPDDIPAIVSRVQLLSALDRPQEALAAARDASRLGISDPLFVHLWLLLEFRVGDKDLALEKRARLLKEQPDNLDNSLEYAKNLLQSQRPDDAKVVMDGIEAQITKDANAKNAGQALTTLRAALRGAKGDVPGALDDFEKTVAALPADRREGAYLDFADLVRTLGGTDLVIQVLDKGRQYQDPATARIDRMLGDTHFGVGHWELARVSYNRARESAREDKDNLLLKRIIECLMRDKKLDEAQKLIDAQGGDKSRDLQILLLGSQLELTRGNRAKGLTLLDKAVEAAPNQPLPYRQRGLERMNDPKTIDDGILDLEQALGMDPRNTELVVIVSRAYVRKGDPAHGLATLDRALSLQTDNPALRSEQIQQLVANQKYSDALVACDAALKADPSNIKWWILKGIVYQRMGDQLSAARAFEEAWKIRKGVETGKALADALMAAYDNSKPKNTGLLDSARTVLNDPATGVEREGMCRMSRVSLGIRQARRAEAVADLRTALTASNLKITDPQTGVFVLDELRRAFSGDMKEVVKLLDEVRPKEGWPDIFLVNIARAHLADAGGVLNNPASTPEQKKSAEDQKMRALDDLELLMKSPDKGAAIGAASTLGANAYLLPDVDRSVRALQAGLAIDGDNVELNNNLAYVLSVGKKENSSALGYALKAAEKDPNNPNILDTVGTIHMNLNQLDKAEEALTRARSIANDGLTRTMPTVHLIQVKLKKNQRSEAELLFQELIDLQTTDPRVRNNYGKDIEELKKSMQATP